jgi:hypothetical protein
VALAKDYSKKQLQVVCGIGGSVEDLVVVPTKGAIKEALEKDPDSCSEEECNAVDFFYRVPLATLERCIKNSRLTEHNDIRCLLGKRWASSMAYALTLVKKLSDLDNIKHNYVIAKEDDGGGAPEKESKKKKKKKMVRKENVKAITEEYYDNFLYFARMTKVGGSGKEDKKKLKQTRRRFRSWERKIGISKDPKSGAQKRQSVAPVQDAVKRHNSGVEGAVVPEQLFLLLKKDDHDHEWDSSESSEDESSDSMSGLVKSQCSV